MFGFRRVDAGTPRRGLRLVRSMQAQGSAEYPGAIHTLCALADGRSVLALDDMGVLMRCDLVEGVVVERSPQEDDSAIEAVALLPNATHLVASRGDWLDVWSCTDLAQPVRSCARGGAFARSVAAHPDGRRIALLTDEGNVEVWDVADGVRLATLEPMDKRTSHVAADEDHVFLCGDRNDVEVWSWSGTRPMRHVHVSSARTVRRLSGGRLLMPDGALLSIWDLEGGDALFHCAPHVHGPCTAGLLDHDRAVSAHFGGDLFLWDVTTGASLAAQRSACVEGFNDVAALAPRSFVTAASRRDGTLELWEIVDDDAEAPPPHLGFSSLVRVGVSQAFARAAGGGGEVVDLRTGERGGPLLPGGRLSGAVLFADEEVVLINDASSVDLVRRRDGGFVAGEHDHALDGVDAQVARSGRLLASVLYEPNCVDLVRLEGTVERFSLGPHPARVAALAFIDAAGERLVAACDDGSLEVWDVERRELVTSCTIPSLPIVALTASDRGWAAARSSDGSVHVFDLVSGEERFSLEGPITSVMEGRDGFEVVTCGSNADVCAWDATTGELLARAPGGSDVVANTAGDVVLLDDRGQPVVLARERPTAP